MRRIFAIAVAALLVGAPAAIAAPTPEKGAVGIDHTTFKWTGSAYGTNLNGEPCNTDHSCEDFLLEVKDPGSVSIGWEATAPGGTPAWLGVTIYASDEKGTEGDELVDGGDLADSGSVGAYADPGFYLVRFSGLLTTLATYEATATLEPDPPAGG
jgi:hypothetical protein